MGSGSCLWAVDWGGPARGPGRGRVNEADDNWEAGLWAWGSAYRQARPEPEAPEPASRGTPSPASVGGLREPSPGRVASAGLALLWLLNYNLGSRAAEEAFRACWKPGLCLHSPTQNACGVLLTSPPGVESKTATRPGAWACF